MDTDFLKLFKVAKWGSPLSNKDAAAVYHTLADLSSYSQQEDFADKYSTLILVFGLTTSGVKNNIAFLEKFLDKTAFFKTIRGAALKVLCTNNYYGQSLQYLDLLKDQVNNINPDNVYYDTVNVSVQALGECAYKNNSQKVLACLHESFCKISAMPRKDNELYEVLDILHNALQYAV